MNLWAYLDARAARRFERLKLRIEHPGFIARAMPTEFRGWVGGALFLQSTFLFTLLAMIPKLSENQGFLTLASAVIVTGWIGGVAAFAYSAGKGSAERGEQVGRALGIIENAQNNPPPPPPAQPAPPASAAEGAHQAAYAATERANEISGDAT